MHYRKVHRKYTGELKKNISTNGFFLFFFLDFRRLLFDIASFDDKHQHPISPASLLTGAAHLVVGHLHEHVTNIHEQKKASQKPAATGERMLGSTFGGWSKTTTTTTVRPTIIDFLSKLKKTKRSVNAQNGIGKIRVEDQQPTDEIFVESSELDCPCADEEAFHESIRESFMIPKHVGLEERKELGEDLMEMEHSGKTKRSIVDKLYALAGSRSAGDHTVTKSCTICQKNVRLEDKCSASKECDKDISFTRK